MIYEASGLIKLTGCAVKRIDKNFLILYALGSKVYIKKKAKMGILEAVVLKKVNRTEPENYAYDGIQPVITYVDTFNRVWIEEELIQEAYAVDLAKIYWRRVEQDAQELLEKGNCLQYPNCN
jgi:hypothetical protein